MDFEKEASDEEKLAEASVFERFIFEEAMRVRIFQPNALLRDDHPLAEEMVTIAFDLAENCFISLKIKYLFYSNPPELTLKLKDGGNFFVKHKRYFMAIYIYKIALGFAHPESDMRATLLNNISAALYFLKLYGMSLYFARKAVAIKPLYGKARKRAAECALSIGQFRICQEMCEKLLEQNQYTAEAGSILAKLQLAADEALEAVNNDPELKRLCEVLCERGVKFPQSRGPRDINERMLTHTDFHMRNSRVHLAKDGVTLVWPILFLFPETRNYHCEYKVVEKTTMKNLLRKILSQRQFAIATQLNPWRCNVYYAVSYTRPFQKVHTKKSIKDIIAEDEFKVQHGNLVFYVSRNMLEETIPNLDFRLMLF